MTTLFRAGVVHAACACVAACAVPGAYSDTGTTAALIGARTISAHDAKDAITIGKSTKAEVIAAVGKTKVISFDSGFEVWVYQYTGDTPPEANRVERAEHADSGNGKRGKAEFVVLFAPSGVVTKTRIRPAPPPSR